MPVFLSEALQCAAFGVVLALVLEAIAWGFASSRNGTAPEAPKEDAS